MALISFNNGKMQVPDQPSIGFIEGDGTGPDIWKASKFVFDAAVEHCFKGKRKIDWVELFAGEKSYNEQKTYLPEATLTKIKELKVAIKGPLTTPVGGGIRSINVALRQELDLYACVRPVKWYRGVGAPVSHPEKVNMTIFRENTEDVYAGIEFKGDSDEGKKLAELLKSFGVGKKFRGDCNFGIKPMGPFGSKRLVRRAIQYALDHGLPNVTLVHKGNIMKFTEGSFRDWGYEEAKTFGSKVIREDELNGATPPKGVVVIRDRIADSMFQQILLRPEEYSVLATPNLNGDYISDALAAQVGGLGIAPGANYSDEYAIFEATHGTAPKYAGQDKVNPGSLILSGLMMFEHLGWSEAAQAIEKGTQWAIDQKLVTYDLERQMTGAKVVKCSEFAQQIVKGMKA